MKNKKAFTLVELIVVITILAILSTIGFISLSWYSKEARDAKRISDANNLLTKINIEQTRGSFLWDLIEDTSKVTLKILSNDNPDVQTFWKANFENLKEDWEDFKDPSDETIDYPLAYVIWWTWSWAYKFFQAATINEKENKTKLMWNYFQLWKEDARSLFLTWASSYTEASAEIYQEWWKKIYDEWSWINYTWETEKCTWSIPANAIKNWTEVYWSTWSYSETEWECKYKCDTNYTWNATTKSCEWSTRTWSCTWLPSNAVWNTSNSITQTWNWSEWNPTTIWVYNPTSSTTECRYNCATDYYTDDNWVSCKPLYSYSWLSWSYWACTWTTATSWSGRSSCSATCWWWTQTRTRSCNANSWTQTRSVQCKRSDWTIVADTYCTWTKPSTTQQCTWDCWTTSEQQSCNTQACTVPAPGLIWLAIWLAPSEIYICPSNIGDLAECICSFSVGRGSFGAESYVCNGVKYTRYNCYQDIDWGGQCSIYTSPAQ